MGGMAAFIPVKNDEEKNQQIFAKVKADKEREVNNGHDGTWIAHPGLAPIANEVFNRLMPSPNQIAKQFSYGITADDILTKPDGQVTEEGLRNNVSVGVQYIEAWISGNGCVPIYNLMEDAATAEISRTQVWQWIKHGAKLADGRAVTAQLVQKVLDEELVKIQGEVGVDRFKSGRFAEAAVVMLKMSTASECADFLTLPAYEYLD
jgi:malate synthase